MKTNKNQLKEVSQILELEEILESFFEN